MRNSIKTKLQILSILFLGLTTVWTHNICVRKEQRGNNLECCEEYHPLKWFVSNDVSNHSIILFLPGTHYLSSSDFENGLIIFDNKYNLSLTGSQYGGKPVPSTVVCHGNQSGFLFRNSMNVSITNLEFQGCRANVNLSKNKSFYGGVFFHLSYYITISQVCIRDSKGYGLHMDNVCGSILIEHSQFIANKNGNVVLWFRHCASTNFSSKTIAKIHHTEFRDGNGENRNGTGLYLLLKQRHIQVMLSTITLINNKGEAGGNMAIRFINFEQDTGYVRIENSTITKGYANGSGGGILVYFERNSSDLNYCNRSNRQITMLTIRNTVISYNNASQSGGGIFLTYDERSGFGCITRLMNITNCTLSYNNALRGSALELTKHNVPKFKLHFVPQLSVIITDCCFFGNSIVNKTEQYNEDGTVEIYSVDTIEIQDTMFRKNYGTALMLVNSGVQFKGKVIFKENSAQYGGAIKICESSQMYLYNETRVQFLNNTADLAGGAIYAGAQCLTETPPCFFQVPELINETMIVDFAQDILYFEGNQAGIAGHAIYGGSVDNCFTNRFLRFNQSTHESYYYSLGLYNRIFNFSDNKELSKVTSDPYGICLCDKTNQIDCKNRTLNVGEIYPGEDFSVYLTPVGQTFDAVPAYVQADGINKKYQVSMNKANQTINELQVFCREMKINIGVNSSNFEQIVSFHIGVKKSNFVSESSNYYKLPKLIVNATLKQCPFLFELVNGKCDCPKIFKKMIGIHCNIDSLTVYVPPIMDKKHSDREIWISCKHNDTISRCDKYEGSNYCQKGHCSNLNTSFDQTNLSLICKDGREGRLCSKCQSNYTLSLGNSQCVVNEKNCHSWGTFLLSFVFVLAGILLVCFFTIFNFTVAEGTVHGLLLYANCIQVIQCSLFNDHIPKIARVFISWLNLNFGIEVCFYAGMTAYQKIWLEFGFLLYLLLLGVMIVCLSHRFVWFTRLAGRNVVPVLATIALFAYPKLVRNSIRVWECHRNYVSSDNNTPYVWYMDETIECFKGKHIVLFAASIPLFIMASLYMLCLLFIQCLQRRSSWFVLRWVNKLRPFFDAHTGPCHDHYRFWPGLLLFARMGLYLAFWVFDFPTKKAYTIGGLCVLLFFLACIFPRGVYKSWPLNLLDFSFIFNLGITSTIVASQSLESSIIGWVSLSIAAFTFSLILVYHSFKRVRETRRWKRFVARAKLQKSIHQITESEESTPLIREKGLPRVLEFTSPREPLLEDV